MKSVAMILTCKIVPVHAAPGYDGGGVISTPLAIHCIGEGHCLPGMSVGLCQPECISREIPVVPALASSQEKSH